MTTGSIVRHLPPRRCGVRRVPELHYAVEDRGHETPCWIYQGSVRHGLAFVGNIPAHVITYQEVHGQWPVGHWPIRACGVGACINPDHLTLERLEAAS